MNASRLRTAVLRPWRTALVVGALLSAANFLFPSGSVSQGLYSNVVSFAFVGLIAVGVRINRPADSATWWLFAVGTSLSIIGDCISTVFVATSNELPFPSIADVVYLSAYPLLLIAVARLGRDAAAYRARERRLDSLIVALGALTMLWQPLLQPYESDQTIGLIAKATLVAYVVMDIVILYILLSAVIFAGRWERVDVLVAISFGVLMFGDITYDILELHGLYTPGNAVDITWLLSYVVLGVAALHPSMARIGTRAAAPAPRLWWLLMVAFASSVPTICLLAFQALHKHINIAMFASLGLAMAALATVRMAWMYQGLRERARQLRDRTVSLQLAVTERDRLADDLRHRAFHDPLTGLANRLLLSERIEQALARSRRDTDLVGLVVCDLDGFKTVNDSLGHQAGDQLLVTTAQRLTSVVRPADTVARLGGDEFAVLLDGVRDPQLARTIAERIVAVMREPTQLGGDLVAVSTSVGVTLAAAGGTAEQLVSDADAAMYEAKSRGKNSYTVFEPSMRSRAQERLQLTAAFAGAVERSEFKLEFQPCYSLTDGQLRSFEALVRWDHPVLGAVAPSRFIPLAEETGYIRALGKWVLEAACHHAASWPPGADGSPTVAVNISALQLADDGFADDVRRALRHSGLPGDRLVLEVTETMLISDYDRTVGILNVLKDLGVRIAIDDFGVGYSSLTQLRNLPVDFVKIDKTFVDQLSYDYDSTGPVVNAILRLARDLNLTTVAEGIEEREQRDLLQAMGCDSGQGFLLSHPLDTAAAAALAARAAESAA